MVLKLPSLPLAIKVPADGQVGPYEVSSAIGNLAGERGCNERHPPAVASQVPATCSRRGVQAELMLECHEGPRLRTTAALEHLLQGS